MWVSMVRCPRCRQEAARRSRRVGARDHLLSVLHLYPFRCQLCTHRFRAFHGRHHSQHGERREYDRLFIRVPAVIAAHGVEAEAETVDLSATGCTVRTEAVYAAGSTVKLRLRLGQSGEVEVVSAVVRAQGQGRLGLQFAHMASGERDRLGAYLDRFLRPTGMASRRVTRPRLELVVAVAVGVAVIVMVLMLMGRIVGPPAP